ncbi:MAG: glycoside hydrolase family 15 protein [Myxococcota bacterium]
MTVDPYDAILVGNGQSAFLIGRDGAVNWGCLPSFDADAVFARMLDPEGGVLDVAVQGAAPVSQRYLPLTTIAVTRLSGSGGTVDLIDFMPRYLREGRLVYPPTLIRILRPVDGSPRLRIRCQPRPGFGTSSALAERMGDRLSYAGPSGRCTVESSLSLSRIAAEEVVTLHRDAFLAVTWGEPSTPTDLDRALELLARTQAYWEGWSRHCHLPGEYQEEILRSALTLKLLIHQPTGAVVAAPTTSLPEVPGDVRNWDYRFCWLRDSYFTVRALASLSHFDEQARYLGWLADLPLHQEPLPPVFSLDGATGPLVERTIGGLAGALGSRPVRVGNQAVEHRQNDVYGELMLSLAPVLLDIRFQEPQLRETLWSAVTTLADAAMRAWALPDAGIWEYRDLEDHYVFSKVMCWVALHEASGLAAWRGDRPAARRWRREAATIHAEVLSRGWSDELGAFTGAYGKPFLDASVLLMASIGFLPASDPRYRSTVAAVERHLVVDDLCYRYRRADDFGVPSATFGICTFWYVDALFRIGREADARRVFEGMLRRANHAGLFAEGIDPSTGRMTGNFPQAYSHVALINSGMLLARTWGERAPREDDG